MASLLSSAKWCAKGNSFGEIIANPREAEARLTQGETTAQAVRAGSAPEQAFIIDGSRCCPDAMVGL